MSTGHLHINGFDPIPLCPKEKEGGICLSLFLGAGDRDRTGTVFTPRDFKLLFLCGR